VLILEDEGFELSEAESLQKYINAIDKQVHELVVAANQEATQVTCI
jgi:hypothetical protein